MSSVAHLKISMGNKGPKDEEDLPDNSNVHHIEDILTKQDKAALGQDYLLINMLLRDALLHGIETGPAEK